MRQQYALGFIGSVLAIFAFSTQTRGQGACCLPDDSCNDVLSFLCGSVGGTLIDGESCSTIDCANLPVGACCDNGDNPPFNSCVDNVQLGSCTNGPFLGAGTVCLNPGVLGDCTFSDSNLPVELVSFTAISSDGSVLLTWETASELSNAGFEVEQRVGDNLFAPIAFVEGAGTTVQSNKYERVVTDLTPGTYGFRLKQIDFDGTFEYSAIVLAAITVPDRFVIEPAYPNPFNPSTTLSFAVGSEQFVEVVLFNTAGQAVASLYTGTVEADRLHTVRVDAGELPSGTYIVRLEGASGIVATEQIVLAK